MRRGRSCIEIGGTLLQGAFLHPPFRLSSREGMQASPAFEDESWIAPMTSI